MRSMVCCFTWCRTVKVWIKQAWILLDHPTTGNILLMSFASFHSIIICIYIYILIYIYSTSFYFQFGLVLFFVQGPLCAGWIEANPQPDLTPNSLDVKSAIIWKYNYSRKRGINKLRTKPTKMRYWLWINDIPSVSFKYRCWKSKRFKVLF